MTVGQMPIVCELFAGVGGMSLGAARAGFVVRAAVEIDERSLQAHHRNFPLTKQIREDVSSLSGKDLLEKGGLMVGEIDGLIGGPPCQGFSVIGRRRSGDERNELFWHFFRLIDEIRPRFFVAENVLGILDKKYSGVVSSALNIVSNDYELLGPITVTASDYGVPTSRKRAFFIGIHNKLFPKQLTKNDFLPTEGGCSVFVRDALRGLPAKISGDWKANRSGKAYLHNVKPSWYLNKLSNDIPADVGDEKVINLLHDKGIIFGHIGTSHSEELEMRYNNLRPGEQDPVTKSVRLRANGYCPTLRAGTTAERGSFQAVRPIHHRYPRVITPREAARLQSFPDWFQFDNTKWHSFRQIGNSVPPIVAEKIFQPIANALIYL